MPEFQYRVKVDEATNWELYKKSLEWELTDRAEQAAREKYGPAFDDLEVDTRVTTQDGHFVVTFTWREGDLPATRRVRISFDIITRRSGTATLDIPTGSNPEELLNNYLNAAGDKPSNLPETTHIHEWDVQETGERSIEIDWIEDLTPEENT